MPDYFAASIGNEIDEQALGFYCVDGVLSAARSLKRIRLDDPETLRAFDELSAQAKAAGRDVLSTALAEDAEVSAGLAAFVVCGYLYHWADGGGDAIDSAVDLIRSAWPRAASASGDFEQRLLDAAFEALLGVAAQQGSPRIEKEAVARASQGFLQMAKELESKDYLDDALACALTATNFATADGPVANESASRVALRLARRGSNDEAARLLSYKLAQSLCQIARTDSSRQLEAYDALEAAMRNVPTSGPIREDTLQAIQSWIENNPYLRSLGLVLRALHPEVPGPPLPMDEKTAALTCDPIWEGDPKDWYARFSELSAFCQVLENERLAIQPAIPSVAARTIWSTWAVEHPGLRRAVPHSRSLDRDANRNEILLELNHEITHVYSIAGVIGTALLAMQWTVFEIEVALWSWIDRTSDEASDDAIVRTKAPAPLAGVDITALAAVEQSLELELKMRRIKQTWHAWFEGLAVFGELSADPRQHPDASPPSIDVIYNLWDKSRNSLVGDSGLSAIDAVKRDRASTEEIYAEAMAAEGRSKLRGYLDSYHETYLSGYLTVRSVVAAWRSTLERPLSGLEAFILLLHATRYSGLELIPDLDLPAEQFNRMVIERHVEWVRALASMSHADLENALSLILTPAETNARLKWNHGRIEQRKPGAEAEREAEAILAELSRQCGSAARGANADPDRVPDASPACRETMMVAADALGSSRVGSGFSSGDLVSVLVDRLHILPLGQASSPFWLLTANRTMACMIRTREKDARDGLPSYDLIAFPLSDESFSGLSKEVALRGDRRMIVTRVADLLAERAGIFGIGRNYMVFQYGDWIHVQPRGIFFGSDEYPPELLQAIRSRLAPHDPLIAFDKITGDAHPAAERTKAWISSTDWRLPLDHGGSVDLGPWALHVGMLAEMVGAQVSKEERMSLSKSLSMFVVGDEMPAQVIAERGLEPIRDANSEGVRELVALLDKSGRQPEPDAAGLQTLAALVQDAVGTLVERTRQGWDVVRPAELRRG